MIVSKKLQRQFKKAFGNADFDKEVEVTIGHLKSLPSLNPEQEKLLIYLNGFQIFFETVQTAFDQSDKMLGISNRSLSISSDELNLTNHKLKEAHKTVQAVLKNLGEGLKAARDIQQSLMPPLHQEFEDITIDVLYHPSEDLSGDFFDVYKKDQWLYFYLADVTSHGTASAQVTYLIKGIFQEIMSNSPNAPDLDFLIKDFARRYVEYKLSYAVGLQMYRYDLQSKKIEVCASNAPAPILVQTGASKQISITPGPLIYAGSFDLNYVFSVQSEILSPGSSCYCFTDGAIELNNTGQTSDFNERKFAKILAAAPHEGWETSILESLKIAAKKPNFDDDITILRFFIKS